MKEFIYRVFFLVFTLLFFAFITSTAHPAFAATDIWPTSLHDNFRTGASNDTTLSASNASQLVQKWVYKTGGPVAAAPVVADNTVFVGSWDGNMYALDAATGNLKWKTNLGITVADPICIPPQLGISSSATVQNGTVYVGGGDSNWYALSEATGGILWSVPTGDNTATGGHYNWSSPLIYNGFAYVGIASVGDCPLVQGLLLKIDLARHFIVGVTKIVPDGQVGGGIWQSPSIDPATNKIFVATGTENSPTQSYAQAMLAIDATTMQIVDSWKLPESQAILDSDFSTTATLFTDANNRQLVAAINKNGDAYAFDRNHLSNGPVWQKNVALGDECPTCGASSVSSSTFQGGTIYFAGAAGTINGYTYKGTVRAINPATGNYIWQYGAPGSIIPALASANGLIFDSANSVFEVLNATTGLRLWSYDTGAQIYAPTTVANGLLYTGNLAGTVMAFGLPSSASTPPPDPNCPTGFTCQDIGSPQPAGLETVTSGTWNIQAGGAGITGNTDSFRLMSQATTGDVRVSAQVTGNAANQAGVMLRQSNDPGSPYYSIALTPNNGVAVQYRKATGGATSILNTLTNQTLPRYIAVERIGDTYQAATSTDGNTFTLVPGTTVSFTMPNALLSGLAVASGTQGTAKSSTITNVTIGQTISFQAPSSQNPCPTGWSCQDIGNPSLVGDQSLSGSTYTIKGAGNDIWGYADTFRFVWQTIATDATLTARVATVGNTDGWAKAGIMMRASTDPASAHYSVYVTPTNGVLIQYRAFTGFTSFQATSIGGAAPQYIRISRSGNTFTAYTSTDGNTWSFVPGSTVTLSNLSGTLLAGLAVTAHNGGLVNTSTLDTVSIINSAPTPPNVCPAGFTCEDIGFPTPSGGQTLSGNTWTIDAGGGDIWGTIDSYRFVFQPFIGDGTATVRVASQTNTNVWAKAGIMLRLTDDQSSPYYAVFTTPGNGTIIQYRTAQNGNTSQITASLNTAPVYLRITRAGTTFSASISTNGVNWTAVAGSGVSIPSLSGTITAGMAVTSHNPSDASQVAFDSLALNGQQQGTGCPANWACTDIGAPTITGSTAYANNTFTLNGAGNDIWGTADQFQYAYQPLNGDGDISAQVLSQTNTDPWAKAGVMIKESATTGAKYVLLAVTPGNGLHLQYNFNVDAAGWSYTFPAWIRLKRVGNIFTPYTSTDGSNWVQQNSITLPMNTKATVGLFVTSHNGGQLGTATFANVAITNNPVPSPWTDNDISSPSLPGSASYSNGTYTVNGAGSDIWGNIDQFNYLNQPLAGDGSIIARVTSQSPTDPWAKAGVMIKESAVSGAKYISLAVTPGNGIHAQYNFTADQSAGTYSFPNAWLKLSRAGNTFTTSVSQDGLNWTLTSSVSLAMNTNATVGLFVTSHNNTQVSGVTFDHVALTQGAALPSGWSATDIGSPALGGSASFANGLFTLNGSGSDIWGTTDQLQYAYQPISGDATISARIVSQTNTDPWAKAGVMIKQSTTPLSPYVWLGITPENGLRMQYNFNSDISAGANFEPQWLRLVRSGNTFTGYTSIDGKTWTQATQTTVTMSPGALIGLFVNAHNNTQLGTAVFDSVAITQP